MSSRRDGVRLGPGGPGGAGGQLRERSRLEWRIGDAGDPAALLEDFLADQGLPVRDLAAGAARAGPSAGRACGATLFVSAAAGARLAGAPTGAPSPVAAIPDVVCVAWEPAGSGRPPCPRRPGAGWPGTRHRPWRLGRWRSSWSPAEHAGAVEEVRAAIARGDVYQVNVVGHTAVAYRGDPAPALRRLVSLPGARYAGILRGGRGADGDRTGTGMAGWAVACASPETLVAVAGGRVLTRPIKGTRPATGTGRAELLASPKERAEHVMIVDLERNDLARLARTGSVRVDRLYAVRRWCDLWQAESEISAAMADGLGLADLLRAVCPGGSVTGAPKAAALALIARTEPVGRGPSMGALGWVGHGDLDLGLTIRTAAVDPARIHLWAGGGITWGSDPSAEVAEAAAKATPMIAALAGRPGDTLAAGVGPQSSGVLKMAARSASARLEPSAEC